MDSEEFMALRDTFDRLCEGILEDKGKGYSREEQIAAQDRLGNFKRAAEACGADPLQVALIFFMKHVDSLCTWVTDMAAMRPDVFLPESAGEPIELRLADLRNYDELLLGLVVERAKQSAVTKEPGYRGARLFLGLMGVGITIPTAMQEEGDPS